MKLTDGIVLINAGETFRTPFTKRCFDLNIPCQVIDSGDCIIILEQKEKMRFICNNKVISLKKKYFFIRIKTKNKNTEFVTLLCEMLDLNNIPFNDTVINTRYSYVGEKFVEALWFKHNNIPHPLTIICTQSAYITNETTIFEKISFPCVIKDKSERSEGVWKVSNKKEAEETIAKIEGAFIIQEFIPNNYDIRILVWNQTILGTIKRSSTDGFLNGISAGGKAGPIKLSDVEKKLSIQACTVCKLNLGGVDIIRTKNGPIVLEVNKSPQIKGLTRTTGINIPAQIVEQINKKYLQNN